MISEIKNKDYELKFGNEIINTFQKTSINAKISSVSNRISKLESQLNYEKEKKGVPDKLTEAALNQAKGEYQSLQSQFFLVKEDTGNDNYYSNYRSKKQYKNFENDVEGYKKTRQTINNNSGVFKEFNRNGSVNNNPVFEADVKGYYFDVYI